MALHSLRVVRDKNSILLRGERKHFGVRNSLKVGLVRGQEIHRRFAAPTTFDNHVVEVGVRQEADRPSASPRRPLPPHALEFLFDIRRCWMGCDVGILRAPAFLHHLLHFVLVV